MIPKAYDDFIVVEGGMKRVSTLIPSIDRVVEFHTNRLLDIRDIGIEVIPLLNVKLSDGTETCIFAHDYTIGTMELYPVDFHNDDELYRLDPYTVGSLLMYGDYDDEYINLPSYFSYVNSYLLDRNGWEMGQKLGTGGKVYFAYKYSNYDLVRWTDFFRNVKCRVMEGCEPVFPLEYATGTFRTRRQLLSGVFDVGYVREPFDNRLQISSIHEERLMAVHDILRSMKSEERRV
ncbi:MAG: hypothetical protein HDQ88_07340, partial [Clostridia bacterium]|nr:hypothetical protein [Clostridia bacterium]